MERQARSRVQDEAAMIRALMTVFTVLCLMGAVGHMFNNPQTVIYDYAAAMIFGLLAIAWRP
jgi:cbb3-type cytochrome oxidase subunit 3